MTTTTSILELAQEVGKLVELKDKAYGNAFDLAGQFLKLLYPDGATPEQFPDMLCLVRIFDKMKRIATNKEAFSESPYSDIIGYALLGLRRSQRETASRKRIEKVLNDEELTLRSPQEAKTQKTIDLGDLSHQVGAIPLSYEDEMSSVLRDPFTRPFPETRERVHRWNHAPDCAGCASRRDPFGCYSPAVSGS